LVVLFCLISVALSKSARFLATGHSGSDTTQNSVYWFLSANYQEKPASATGDVFAALMGYQLGSGVLTSYPYAAVAHVQGAVDLNTDTTGGETTTDLTASASAQVVAWAFIAIGEFCNVDGVVGYQPKVGGDYIINYFSAPLGALPTGYKSDGYSYVVNGANSYVASVESAGGNFNTSCRVYDKDTTYNGHPVSSYDFECDVAIDYKGLWSVDATQLLGCTDDNRYIGVLIDVVGASFDADVTVVDLNAAIANSQNSNKISFNGGKLEFSWANYLKVGATKATVAGVNHAVVATYLTADTQISYSGATTAQQIIFTFDTPKSAGNDFFLWDPQTTVKNAIDSSSSVVALFSLVFLSLALNFF